MTSYRTFWWVCGLYFLTLGIGTASGMEVLKWLASVFEDFGEKLNISRIPLYHFPDVWLNLIWVSGLLKVFLAIMVVISVTNEFTYRTLRQNIIDGMSRRDFIVSKIATDVLLSLASVLMTFLIGLITGLIYSPTVDLKLILTDLEFIPVYFLEIFFFLSYALMLSLLIQRSGLTIILLLLSQGIEGIVQINIDDYVPWLVPYLPMQSIRELIAFPFPRYALQEIHDYVNPLTAVVVIGWTFAFNYLGYLKLKRADI